MRARTISTAGKGTTTSHSAVSMETVRHGLMVIVSLSFFALYGAALVGWLRPLSDLTLAGRLEPIIFLLIGYYFGGLPSKRTDTAAKEEIERIGARLEVVRLRKDELQSERDSLVEKIRNAKIALGRAPHRQRAHGIQGQAGAKIHLDAEPNGNGGLETSADIVRNILDS